MTYAEIEVGDPWDAFTTLRKLDELEEMTKDFISHTMQTLSQPRMIHTPEGVVASEHEVVHPLGEIMGALNSCRRGCHAWYGQQQYSQFALFEEQMNGISSNPE